MGALLCATILLVPSLACAQDHQHSAGMVHPTNAAPTTLPTLAGQDAYTAVAVFRSRSPAGAGPWSRSGG